MTWRRGPGPKRRAPPCASSSAYRPIWWVELKADIERLQDDHATVLGAVHMDYGAEIERLVGEIEEAQAFIALFPADLVALIMGQQAVADTEGGAEGENE